MVGLPAKSGETMSNRLSPKMISTSAGLVGSPTAASISFWTSSKGIVTVPPKWPSSKPNSRVNWRFWLA